MTRRSSEIGEGSPPSPKKGRPVGWTKPKKWTETLPAVRVDAELKEWLDAEAERQERSPSDMIRIILKQAKRRQEEGSDHD